MNLYIRSQNKEVLILNPKLALENIENEYWIVDLCDDTVLGTYKSKERALEILDDIQNLISEDEYMHISQTKIYEMPEE